MFRQVVMFRWVEGTPPAARQAYRQALAGLRQIPEVVNSVTGDDAGHAEGDFNFVVAMDFDDVDTYERYKDHQLHRDFVHDHAERVVGEMVRVQHEWRPEQAST